MKKAVLCSAKSENQANLIVEKLRADFSLTDISVLLPDRGATRQLGHEKNTKAPEGAATGTAVGGLLGGTLGLLAGIGALAIPGVGPLIAAGPILAALSGAAAGAAAGGVTGTLVGLGIPEYEAKRYEGMLRSGDILISVHTESAEEIERAKNVFKAFGADDIGTVTEAKTPSTAAH